jgi:acetylornithine deacetylase/succinyl-diaminopimelate desuccinylase-like protein
LARALTSKEAEFGLNGPGDCNWFAKKGLTVVDHGADGAGIHGANEHVRISTLIDTVKTYASMMIDWCGVSEIR